jgi:precorrin-6x reductase
VQAGFTQETLLCLRPPFSREFNRSILREYKVEVLVTKASGAAGGVVEKVMAAQDLGLKTLMIRRPVPSGLLSVSTPDAAVRLCQEFFAMTPTREGVS